MSVTRSILRRLELGEFFFGAIDIRFMCAAELKQLLLATHVCFGEFEFRSLTLCRRDLGGFG